MRNDIIQDWVEQLSHDLWLKAKVFVSLHLDVLEAIALLNYCIYVPALFATEFSHKTTRQPNSGSSSLADSLSAFLYLEIINEAKPVYWILPDIILNKALAEYFTQKGYELFIYFLSTKRTSGRFVNFFDCSVLLNLMYGNVKGSTYKT